MCGFSGFGEKVVILSVVGVAKWDYCFGLAYAKPTNRLLENVDCVYCNFSTILD